MIQFCNFLLFWKTEFRKLHNTVYYAHLPQSHQKMAAYETQFLYQKKKIKYT